jgi:hypothetical protein
MGKSIAVNGIALAAVPDVHYVAVLHDVVLAFEA